MLFRCETMKWRRDTLAAVSFRGVKHSPGPDHTKGLCPHFSPQKASPAISVPRGSCCPVLPHITPSWEKCDYLQLWEAAQGGDEKQRCTERGARQEGCTVPKGKQNPCNALIRWTDCKSLQSRRMKAGGKGTVLKWVWILLLVPLGCCLLVVGSPVRQASCCASMAGSSRLLRVGSRQLKAEPDATRSYKIKKFRCFA